MTVMSEFCDRTQHCLNFRHGHETYCSICQCSITTNHFHSAAAGYRVCNSCFAQSLSNILAGNFTPIGTTVGERPECTKIKQCFAQYKYSLFTEKLCDVCGCYPAEHYHDITRNIRLCLACFCQRRALYISPVGTPR